MGIKDEEWIIEVWNKIDLLDEQARSSLPLRHNGDEDGGGGNNSDGRSPIAVSAVSGEGLELLITAIDARISNKSGAVEITLAPERLSRLDWVYANSQVLGRTDRDDGSVALRLRARPAVLKELRQFTRVCGHSP